jgi:hypothetical protein
MAKKAGKSTARSSAKRAGTPKTSSPPRAAAANRRPSAKELDLRDRMKVGPRRPAGPPLLGDTMNRAALAALRREVLPAPTDPSNRRGRN